MSTTDIGMRRTPVPVRRLTCGQLPPDGRRQAVPPGDAAPLRRTASRPRVRPFVAVVLIRVRGALPSLRPAEQRVAEAVLADPAGVSERSITALARLCRTSETTVLRFCRALGLAGYPELRIALARAAQGEESDRASAGHARQPSISATDSLADMVAKITYADQRSIADTGAARGRRGPPGRGRRGCQGPSGRRLRGRGERAGRAGAAHAAAPDRARELAPGPTRTPR